MKGGSGENAREKLNEIPSNMELKMRERKHRGGLMTADVGEENKKNTNKFLRRNKKMQHEKKELKLHSNLHRPGGSRI